MYLSFKVSTDLKEIKSDRIRDDQNQLRSKLVLNETKPGE
jgi:hypothetical protein